VRLKERFLQRFNALTIQRAKVRGAGRRPPFPNLRVWVWKRGNGIAPKQKTPVVISDSKLLTMETAGQQTEPCREEWFLPRNMPNTRTNTDKGSPASGSFQVTAETVQDITVFCNDEVGILVCRFKTNQIITLAGTRWLPTLAV
jgi:hypothetical protein